VVIVMKKVIRAMLSFISKLKDISIKDNKKPPSPFPPMSKLAPAPASPVIPANQIASTAKILTPSYQSVSSPSSASSASSTTTTSTRTSTSASAGRKTSYWPPKSAARLINDADKQYAQRVLNELASSRVTPPPPSISTASSVKNHNKYWPPKSSSMYRAASTNTLAAATVNSADSPVSTPVKEVVNNSDHDNEDKKEVDNHDYLLSAEVDIKNIKSSDAKYFPPIPVKYYYQ